MREMISCCVLNNFSALTLGVDSGVDGSDLVYKLALHVIYLPVPHLVDLVLTPLYRLLNHLRI